MHAVDEQTGNFGAQQDLIHSLRKRSRKDEDEVKLKGNTKKITKYIQPILQKLITLSEFC